MVERKPAMKFKRSLKPNTYGEEFKKQMNIDNFKKYNLLEGQSDDLEINIIKSSEITKLLKSLPNEIQKKLYILSMQNYWKIKTLETSLRPMYHDYISYIEKQKAKVFYDNIHFMHLECNTIEDTKEWIPGCQCDFCLHNPMIKKKYKQKIYDEMLEGNTLVPYEKCVHCYDNNYWNAQFKLNYVDIIGTNEYYCIIAHTIFNPLKGGERTIYDQIKDQDSPLYFSNELISSI